MPCLGTPRSRRLADLSALMIAFLICLSVIVFSWPSDHVAGSDVTIAKCCEVQTADLGQALPVSFSPNEKVVRERRR
jgi:hypothetical protein